MEGDKLVAFPDGYSFVGYNRLIDRLIIGNSEGLVKVFNVNEPDLEPSSIDIPENLTSFSYYSDKLLVTNLEGHLELVDLDKNESKGTIHRSELPLRDAIFINEGKRVICGGDDNKLVLVDLSNNNNTSSISIPDQLLNLSYNLSGEILSISLANGNIQIYSVINEVPSMIQTLSDVLPKKINTSITSIDFSGEHKDDLQCTKTEWTSNGELLLIPSISNSIVAYNREDWKTPINEFKTHDSDSRIIDFCLSPDNKHLAILYFDSSIKVFNFSNKSLLEEKELEIQDGIPINLVWKKKDLYIGTTIGEIITIKDVVGKSNNNLNNLFVDEAEELEDEGNNTDALLNQESEGENANNSKDKNNGLRLHEEDSMLIDEDDGIDQYYNKDVNSYLDQRRASKRHKSNGYPSSSIVPLYTLDSEKAYEIEPYSPGSTPWNNKGNSNTSVDRRYLSMNSIAYAWAVKNLSNEDINQQSITISFFDRSINKDYHFIDSNNFDLCSINTKGVLFGQSGFQDKKTINNGRIYYRNHESEQDSWEKIIPLLENEYITSISISSVPDNAIESDAKIIIGTNFGYLRFFNLHGVCINIMKTSPIVTLVSSFSSTLFLVNQIAPNVYTYSLIDINDDYKYIQQDVLLPLRRSPNHTIPLIKGIFFNEYNDPCLVGGSDDTLLILQSWRETNNSKWIPLLNCNNIITEYQSNENKKNWKCWPLGLYREELNCIILKNNSHYPGFPLPLPIELEINLPVLIPKLNKNDILTEEETRKPIIIDQEDPEENFLRSLTMGKLVSDSLNSEEITEENDTMMERLEQYSMTFDKSLLKLFGSACKDYKLKRAFSIAKLIKSDKALFAASKICERMDFTSLASKINKLREDLASLSDEED